MQFKGHICVYCFLWLFLSVMSLIVLSQLKGILECHMYLEYMVVVIVKLSPVSSDSI